jgi:DNA-binding NtrC family response regulator
MTLSVLVVDDDESIRSTLVEFFESFGYTARGAGTATEARQLAREHAPDVVLLDLRLPDADGLVALEALRADDPELAVIVLSGFADVRTAVRAMHRGAADVLEKPVDLEALASVVAKAAEPARLRQEVAVLRANSRQGVDGSAPARFDPTLAQLVDLAARNPDAPVLLQGETGSGKGYIARQIHDSSARNNAPFVEVNCASLSVTFFETELFGYERGAFTDARQAKRGLLEVAGDGTVFLDEIAEVGVDVQARLLKVLEEKTFRRLGGTTVLRSAARIIVATNQSLVDAVSDRRFRADLFYRLQVLTLTIPPLRTRPHDILPMARAFLPRGASLDPSAEPALERYAWPGNVRELKNAIWRAAILADGSPIREEHLGLTMAEASDDRVLRPEESTPVTIEHLEIEAIRRALAANNGNRTHAARQLGIARSTLLEKIKRFKL